MKSWSEGASSSSPGRLPEALLQEGRWFDGLVCTHLGSCTGRGPRHPLEASHTQWEGLRPGVCRFPS